MVKLSINLSIVFPLYNEQERFQHFFPILKKIYQDNPAWEFIFVNDGSIDETENLVKSMIADFPRMKFISYQPNQGKGYALKRGILKATKPYVLFSDIDFSTPMAELETFLPFIKKGADVVMGTRKVKGATILKHQNSLREWLGKGFTDLTNFWLRMDISDYTCGFKLFKTQLAKKLFRQQKIKRWSFDAEILFLAQRKGYKIAEVPVIWKNDAQTKVRLGKDIIRSLLELWRIKWHDWGGRYHC